MGFSTTRRRLSIHLGRRLNQRVGAREKLTGLLVVAAVALGTLASPAVSAAATTFTVNSTLDPGIGTCDATECTLREAIDAANAAAGTDTIAFNITGVPSIKPLSELPTITDPAIVDGTTQPGFAGSPVVELDGSLAGFFSNGLTITAGSSTVRGLVINRFFPRTGILLSSLGANRIEGNYIGTDVTGTVALKNGVGLRIEDFDGAGNSIGGTSASARNVISGNDNGVFIRGLSAGGNLIQGNYIGTDPTGASAVGNASFGIGLEHTVANTIGGTVAGARNVISGSSNGPGVSISGSSGNLVLGNYIGTDVGGSLPLGNQSGVMINDSGVGSTNYPASNNTVGGSTPAARNVISGNSQGAGVDIEVNIGFSPQGEQNSVRGNYIGTDASGTADLGNLRGVQIQGPNNTVGGTSAADRNVISGNDQEGVFLGFNVASGNKIQGNFIGTDAAGTGPLGNSSAGVGVNGGVDNSIGGSASGAGNVIAFNRWGVYVLSGTGNGILSNSIFSNSALGIDLGLNGVTLNDPGDTDSGANNVQNFPVLTSASSSGGSTTVQGTLNSTASTTFRVEFFSSPSCDPAGFGEGKTFLGSQSVTTNGSGNASFTATVPTGTSPGSVVTSTATDPANNTSEFSSCVTTPIGKISARGTVQTAQGPKIGFSAVNNCTPALSTQPSIVGTTAGARIWTKTTVTQSSCTDAPPASPLGFDTQTGTATGTFGPSAPGGRNGQQGTLQWTYRDNSPDTVQFTLRDSSNTIVYQANQQTPTAYQGSPGGVWTFGP